MKTMKLTGISLAVALSIGLFAASCSDDDSNNGGGSTLPPIGGYNSADEVGAADLLAYWPLNGDGKESKSGVAPSNSVNTTFVEGAKGQAASFNLGFLDYPVIPAINAGLTSSVTVSLWAKVSNNQTNATMFFQMTRPTGSTNGWNGGVNVMAETGRGNRPITADTLMVKGLFNIFKPDASEFGGDAVNAESLTAEDIANGGVVNVNKTAGQWMHVVYVYDGTTANNRLYVNGVKISNPQWESRNGGTGVPFNLQALSHPLIGTFGTIVAGTPDGWQKSMVGQVDEIRIWKKSLSQADIGFLYELERAGR